ncbi:DUF4177 domain-containing protein [Halomarina rubra]|uniref:DUF4177 domain-containing protein n=1 Tax=Halomarina rubra TaxID=2071873 RepID=A0ABD6AYE6_9EURY|nr:DUF4177 domain-containing protein [Halomarina rubra]
MRFEYKIVDTSGGGLLSRGDGLPSEVDLNDLGEQGWELTTSFVGSKRSLGGRPKSTTDALVFKRRIEE